jgi:DNA segregation ATPase FtsK/SpoIIIE-like protein
LEYSIISFDSADLTAQDWWTVCDRKMLRAMIEARQGAAVILAAEMGSSISLLEWIEKWQNRFSKDRKKLYLITANDEQLECLEYSHPDLNLSYFSSSEELAMAVPAVFTPPSLTPSPKVAPRVIPKTIETPVENLQAGEPMAAGTERSDLLDEEILTEQPESPVSQTPAPPPPAVQPAQITSSPAAAPDVPKTAPAPQPPPPQKIPIPSIPVLAPEPPSPAASEPCAPSDSPNALGTRVEIAGEYVCCGCGQKRMYIKGGRFTSCENAECLHPESGWRLTFDLF